MQKLHSSIRYISLALLGMLAFTSCTSYSTNTGKTALEQQVITFSEETDSKGVWQTKDLTVNYTIVPLENTFTVTGTMEIKRHIRNSFPEKKQFVFYLNYLDADNRVLSTHAITPNLGYGKEYSQTLQLRTAPDAPSQAVGFTFNYWGIFSGQSVNDERTGNWEIYHDPFIDV